MTIFETTRFAIRGVTANKLRSGLTVLGMLIGVAAVILLVAVGNGTSKQIQDRINNLGTTTLTVSAGGRTSNATIRQTATNARSKKRPTRPPIPTSRTATVRVSARPRATIWRPGS